ncbi:MAG: fumarylacetoacetate hydrolase family protein [Chloroflexi bacterium]|nr:fumarylacetoacetate hydrolase family protein [Chloroflexota bacterium]
MKIVRFVSRGSSVYGVLEGSVILGLEGDILGQFQRGEPIGQVDEVTVLAPCQPSKVIAVGLNYRDHAEEMRVPLPSEPIIFLKPSTAVIGPEEAVVLPRMATQVDYEGELAVVIGRRAKNISVKEAQDYILGFTCGNDVTARDLQKKDGQWTRAKSFDTFCPLGPYLVTDIDVSNLPLQVRVNGQIRQSSTTANLVFRVDELVSFISQVMTLLPGDVILSGTPAGVGALHPGDTVEVEIGGIGLLRNHVVMGQ